MTQQYWPIAIVIISSITGACREKPRNLSTSLDPVCQASYDARAEALVTDYAACQVDADCTLVYSGCLSPLLCATPVARATSSEFELAADGLISDFIDECGNFCFVADCEDASAYRTTCDGATGQCSVTRNEPLPAAAQP